MGAVGIGISYLVARYFLRTWYGRILTGAIISPMATICWHLYVVLSVQSATGLPATPDKTQAFIEVVTETLLIYPTLGAMAGLTAHLVVVIGHRRMRSSDRN